MNFGDPNEFELIPSDSDRMEAVVGPDDEHMVVGEPIPREDLEPYEPPRKDRHEPPEEYDETFKGGFHETTAIDNDEEEEEDEY